MSLQRTDEGLGRDVGEACVDALVRERRTGPGRDRDHRAGRDVHVRASGLRAATGSRRHWLSAESAQGTGSGSAWGDRPA